MIALLRHNTQKVDVVEESVTRRRKEPTYTEEFSLRRIPEQVCPTLLVSDFSSQVWLSDGQWELVTLSLLGRMVSSLINASSYSVRSAKYSHSVAPNRVSHYVFHCGSSRAYSSKFNRSNHTICLLLTRNRREVS
jgi:hypothetical protein